MYLCRQDSSCFSSERRQGSALPRGRIDANELQLRILRQDEVREMPGEDADLHHRARRRSFRVKLLQKLRDDLPAHAVQVRPRELVHRWFEVWARGLDRVVAGAELL